MNSNTSSENDLQMFDNNGHEMDIPPLKKETSETDFYLNLLANPNKTRVESVKSSSSLNNFNDNNNDSDTSSVRNNRSNKKNDYSRSERRSEHRSEHRSERRTDHRSERRSDYHDSDSSRAEYEDVKLSHNSEKTESPVKLTGQQLRMKKIDLLRKLSDLKTKGYKLTKEYDFNSSIEEMEYEYDLLKSFADRRNGIKLYKNTIINFTNLVEFFNDKYDPFGVQLGGWSEHMSVEVDSYDDVLEELYEKYKGAGKSLPPEVKLLVLIGFSASAFHFSQKHMSSIPGSNNSPLSGIQSGIAQKIASMGKEKSRFMSEQELNIERQKEEMREKDKMMKNMMQNPQMANAKAPVNFNQSVPVPSFAPGGPPSLLIQNKDPRGLIQSNETVRDVLNRLHKIDTNDNIETQDESINDRLLSDTTASESKKKGKKKKNLMTIS